MMKSLFVKSRGSGVRKVGFVALFLMLIAVLSGCAGGDRGESILKPNTGFEVKYVGLSDSLYKCVTRYSMSSASCQEIPKDQHSLVDPKKVETSSSYEVLYGKIDETLYKCLEYSGENLGCRAIEGGADYESELGRINEPDTLTDKSK